MNIPVPTPDPEYQPQEHTRLLQEVRNRYRRNKFEEDLRIFLRIPEKTFRSFMNPQFELLSVVRIKLNGEKEFVEELQKFLEFNDKTEDLGDLDETRKKSSAQVQKVLKVEPLPVRTEKKAAKKERPAPNPELEKKRMMIDDLLTHGYSFSSSGYFQLLTSLKDARRARKKGFFGLFRKEVATSETIQPHEIFEHLWKTTMKKNKSSMLLHEIRGKLGQVHIQCDPFDKKTPEPLEAGLLLSSDGFCIFIDLATSTASYDPQRPNI